MKPKNVQSYHNAGMRNCLGWCEKQFYSIDKTNIRYCDTCRNKKEKLEREGNPSRRMADNPLMGVDE